ncbi:MAG: ABC transporter ATP-binding protein [Aggregatilineales bacterium]
MVAIMSGLEEDNYDRQYTDGYLIKRIYSYFAPYKKQLWVVLFAFMVLSFVSALPPVLVAQGVDELQKNSQSNTVVIILGALFVAAVLQYLANWTRRYLLSLVLGNTISKMRKDAFDAAMNRDMAFYDTHKSGTVISRITTDTQEFGDVMLLTSDVIAQMFQVVILVVVLFSRSVELTIILIGTMPVIVLAAMLFRGMARRVTRQGARVMGLVNGMIQESVAGISVAKNFRKEEMIYDEFVDVNNRSYTINLRRDLVLALIFPVMNALSGIAIAIILYVGAQYVSWGRVDIGSWFLFIQGVDRFWFPFISLAAIWSQFQQALSASERIFGLIDADNTIVQTANVSAKGLTGKVEFKDVTFGYEDDQPVLKNFDLKIERGESVAFVGHTGAGKSTIAKLITRFYEFQKGTILIDGQDIRSFDLHTYRARLGIVPQQPFLFSGTVLDNIRYGRPDATDAEVTEVANSVGNGEWLETLPEGLNSDVGERGSRLSMGQRQLVSLMRVLLEKPSIFILDEATASIDPFTETQIQEALDLILAKSTSILIAHRLSTVRNADRIIVLRDGAIIEGGSHEQLMEQGGHYAELYNTYFRHQSLDYIENAREMLSEVGD